MKLLQNNKSCSDQGNDYHQITYKFKELQNQVGKVSKIIVERHKYSFRSSESVSEIIGFIFPEKQDWELEKGYTVEF